MSEYYAVQRSDEFLQHYGVKGMKWGVRRARLNDSSRQLARQYKKASKKLAKLEKRADINTQKSVVKKSALKAGIGLGVGALGITTLGLNKARAKQAQDIINESGGVLNKHKREKRVLNTGLPVEKKGKYLNVNKPALNNHLSALGLPMPSDSALQGLIGIANDRWKGKHPSFYPGYTYVGGTSSYSSSKTGSIYRKDRAIGAGLTALGLGTATYQTGKAIAAKYRTTAKGHAKAVAKRDAWKKEMHGVFKGTKYASLPKERQSNKRKR